MFLSSRPRFVKVRIAAKEYGLTEYALKKAIDQGDLVAYRICRSLYIEHAGLKTWLQSKQIQPHQSEAGNAS
jgi:hypothetical protein